MLPRPRGSALSPLLACQTLPFPAVPIPLFCSADGTDPGDRPRFLTPKQSPPGQLPLPPTSFWNLRSASALGSWLGPPSCHARAAENNLMSESPAGRDLFADPNVTLVFCGVKLSGVLHCPRGGGQCPLADVDSVTVSPPPPRTLGLENVGHVTCM